MLLPGRKAYWAGSRMSWVVNLSASLRAISLLMMRANIGPTAMGLMFVVSLIWLPVFGIGVTTPCFSLLGMSLVRKQSSMSLMRSLMNLVGLPIIVFSLFSGRSQSLGISDRPDFFALLARFCE